MCDAPESYKRQFWKNAPAVLQEEKISFNQPRDKLGDMLVKQKLLTNDQLLRALKTQKETGDKLGTVLVKMGYITDDEVRNALSQQFGLMSYDLDKVEIQEELIDEIGVDLIKKYQIIPIEKQELSSKKMITVAVAAPLPPASLETLQKTIGYVIYPVLAQDTSFQAIMQKITNLESEASKKATSIQQAKAKINTVLTDALKRRASEIIIELEDKELAIHYRIGGKLFKVPSPPVQLSPFIIHRFKVLAKIDAMPDGENGVGKEGRFVVKTKNKGFEFILRSLPVPKGEKLTITIVDEAMYSQKLNKLILDPGSYSVISSLLKLKRGLIILTGPIGSGKVMTLYSLLTGMDDKTRKVISLESPIVMNIPEVIQKEVSSQTGMTALKQLEAAGDEFPDVLAITELNDNETAELLFQMARDSLVILIVESLRPSEVLLYLNGLGIRRINFGVIAAIINQRILPALCNNCRDELPLEEDDAAMFQLSPAAAFHTYRGRGCEVCSGSGYSGFIPLIEVLVFDDATRERLRDTDSFDWVDGLQPPAQARSIKKLVADLLIKGWINVDDARSLDLKATVSFDQLKPFQDGEQADGDTDRISLDGVST